MKKENSLIGFIQAFAVLYIVIWSVSPMLSLDLIYRIIALLLAAVWAVMALMRRIRLDNTQIGAILFAFAVALIAYLNTGSTSSVIKQIGVYIMVVEFIMFCFYCKKDLWGELEFIIPLILAVLIYFNYKTAVVVIDDPNVARQIVRVSDEATAYLRQGIGGYGLVYTQVLMFPAGLMWTMKSFSNSKFRFLLGLGWVVSFVILAFNASYSIALFATCASAVILLLYRGKSITGVIILTAVMFIGTIASIMYITPLRERLLVTFDGTAVARKINDLVAPPEESSGEDSIQVRIAQYLGSLKAMLEYPIIGNLGRSSSQGTHSQVLDTFARYGWAGGYIVVKMLYCAPTYFKKNYDIKEVMRVANAEFVVMIFVSFFDTLPYETMCALFIMVPLFITGIIKWTVKDNESVMVS